MSGNAINVPALIAENNLEGTADELFSPGHTGARFSRDHMIHAYRRALGALRFRLQGPLEFIRKLRPVAGAFLVIRALFIARPLDLVVAGSAFFVRKYIVGRHDFFQFLGGSLIIGIPIGMVLKHKFSIGALDFVCTGPSLHTQQGIIVD